MSEADHEKLMVLWRFYEAWVESEVAMATGAPDLARAKRAALVRAGKAVHALRQPVEE